MVVTFGDYLQMKAKIGTSDLSGILSYDQLCTFPQC